MTEIHLSEDDKAFIEDQVKAGNYRDADEVVAAGLSLMESEKEMIADSEIEHLRALIQEGMDDIANGRSISFEKEGQLTAHILELSQKREARN